MILSTVLNFRFFPSVIRKDSKQIKNNLLTELFFDEHVQEAWQRSLQSIFLIFLLVALAFLESKELVKILRIPVTDVEFFQNSPGEFFVSTLKIAFYTGLLFSIPPIVSQVIFFLLPGLTPKEKIYIIGLIVSSILLFILGLFFSFYVLIPAALTFFLTYSTEVIEPLWSFEQYISFIVVLFVSTGIVFQLPILQIILSLSNILTGRSMLHSWKYVLVFSTIVAAILTPSADPITQLLLSGAVFLLYLLGSVSAIWLQESI